MSQPSHEVSTVILPIMQVRKLRHREVKQLTTALERVSDGIRTILIQCYSAFEVGYCVIGYLSWSVLCGVQSRQPQRRAMLRVPREEAGGWEQAPKKGSALEELALARDGREGR